jgi:hypothetical protein
MLGCWRQGEGANFFWSGRVEDWKLEEWEIGD